MIKAGHKYVCKKCGFEMMCTKSCTCKECNVTCCGEPVVRKSRPKKAKKKPAKK